MIADKYYTISHISEGVYKEKGSKFFGFLYPFKSTEELKNIIDALKKKHPKARHFCYAFSIGIDAEPSNSSDDGEPSGSAGKPILGQLKSHEISDCLAVVVRYFGGSKLGVPGLINAYKQATIDAINNNQIIEYVLSNRYVLECDYEKMGMVMDSLKRCSIQLLEKSFEENVHIEFELALSEEAQLIHKLKAYLIGINPKELVETLDPPGIKLELKVN